MGAVPSLHLGLPAPHLAFVRSLYFGSDVMRFYSAIGWGNSAFVASFLGRWIFAVAITRAMRALAPVTG